MTPDPITPAIAAHVLHELGHGGYPAGSFFRSLYGTMGRADEQNLARLAIAFPAEHAAWVLATRSYAGIGHLKIIYEEGLAAMVAEAQQ